ncbi:MAG TPA: glycerophosphodiester phosphodiesterase family protein [Pelovirga sp.]|nr:glycerophosphodiester phosphodiesterase family protein [Pelovirga sp.]
MSSFFEHLPATGAICAHRGVRSIAPENTMLAFEMAQRCGAHLLETDVQMTADEQLVLFHDRGLKRTTNIADHPAFVGRNRRALTSFTYEELQLLDTGSWFLDKEPFGTVARGGIDASMQVQIKSAQIPLLRDLLKFCRTHNFPINLEIKGKLPIKQAQRRIEVLRDLLVAMDCQDLVLLSSFAHDELRWIKQMCPYLPTAALIEYHHPVNLVEYLKDLQVEAYHPAEYLIDCKLVTLLNGQGIRVNTWTVNDQQRFAELAQIGVSFICSDWPQRMGAQEKTRC